MGYAARAGALLGEGRGRAAKKVAFAGLAMGVMLVLVDAMLMWVAQEEYIAQMAGSSKDLTDTCRKIWPFVIFFLIVDGLFPLNQGPYARFPSANGRVSVSMILSLWIVGVPVTLSSADLLSLWKIFPLCYILLNALLILSFAFSDWDLAAQRASHKECCPARKQWRFDSPNSKNLQPQVIGAEDVAATITATHRSRQRDPRLPPLCGTAGSAAWCSENLRTEAVAVALSLWRCSRFRHAVRLCHVSIIAMALVGLPAEEHVGRTYRFELLRNSSLEHAGTLEDRLRHRERCFGTLRASWQVKNSFSAWRSLVETQNEAFRVQEDHDAQLRAIFDLQELLAQKDLENRQLSLMLVTSERKRSTLAHSVHVIQTGASDLVICIRVFAAWRRLSVEGRLTGTLLRIEACVHHPTPLWTRIGQ
eukprot:s6430_g2.t1